MTQDSPKFGVFVPAKALLFGEYGVLWGYPALVIGFYNPHFYVEMEAFPSQPGLGCVTVESGFFPSGRFVFRDWNLPQGDCFFSKIFLLWKTELLHWHTTFRVVQNFSPRLGFGSSGALIVAVAYLLQKKTSPKKPLLESYLWPRVSAALLAVQGRGSGYDVAVQLRLTLEHLGQLPKNLNTGWLWKYQRPQSLENKDLQPLAAPSQIEGWGCFVQTGIYAPTAALLARDPAIDKNNAIQHGEICVGFLKEQAPLHALPQFMERSLEVGTKQGITAAHIEKLRQLYNTLKEHSIPFKTMGAGHGDCLWVLAPRNTLLQKCGLAPTDIVFSFEDYFFQ